MVAVSTTDSNSSKCLISAAAAPLWLEVFPPVAPPSFTKTSNSINKTAHQTNCYRNTTVHWRSSIMESPIISATTETISMQMPTTALETNYTRQWVAKKYDFPRSPTECHIQQQCLPMPYISPPTSNSRSWARLWITTTQIHMRFG